MDEPVGCPECVRLRARVAELEGMVRDLAAQVKDLTARLQGQPPPRPPADLPAAPDKQPTGRKPGGQPGHPPHLKHRLPADLVTHTVAHVPTTCEHCQAALQGERIKTPGNRGSLSRAHSSVSVSLRSGAADQLTLPILLPSSPGSLAERVDGTGQGTVSPGFFPRPS